MRARLFLLLSLLATPALAQETPGCGDTGVIVPKPANSHAMTQDDYPLLSNALNEQGDVILDFLIGPDGKVSDVKVAKSSGFARLDDAAVAAAGSRWLYTPPTRDGKPIACRRKTRVSWRLTEDQFGGMDSAFVNVRRMGPQDYPAAAKANREQGVTALFIAVDETGKVVQATVLRSSGYPDLDDAALAFAREKWTVAPGRLNGKPVKTAFAMAIVWKLDDTKP
jgi:TonB family protein